MNDRYEIKYLVSLGDIHSLIKDLLVLGFREAFPRRIVTSNYLDMLPFAALLENIDGLFFRNKQRVRYYNNNADECYLENKIKVGKMTRKEVYKVIDVPRILLGGEVISVNDQSGIDNIKMTQRLAKYCSIGTEYSRRYFISANNKLKVTFDTEIKYFKSSRVVSRCGANYVREQLGIVEFKLDSNLIFKSDLIDKIATDHSLIYTRCSKYSRAILKVYGQGMS